VTSTKDHYDSVASLRAGCEKLLDDVKPGRKPSRRAIIDLLQQVLQVARNRPDELLQALEMSAWDEYQRILSQINAEKSRRKRLNSEQKRQRTRSAKARYERSRAFSKRDRQSGLIELQFARPTAPCPSIAPFELPALCLDELLRGQAVKMSGAWNSLDQLFGVDRKYLSEILRRKKVRGEKIGRKMNYDYRAFLAIAEELILKGTWLSDANERQILSRIERRIDEISPRKAIRDAFARLFDSGRKATA
jgi:hypothetical protein